MPILNATAWICHKSPAHAAVCPDVGAELTGGLRRLEHRRELRAPNSGHHTGGAHRAGTYPDLQDVRARADEIVNAVGGDDIARHNWQAEVQR